MKTQGTQMYAVDPLDFSVLQITCVISIDGIDTAIEQIETTCLESQARTYEAGLATPGTATFGIRPNPAEDSHKRLHDLKKAGTSLNWAVGWSDGIDISPTVDSNGEFVLPTSRSWLTFEGFMNSFPFSFQQNAQVESIIGIQVSGDPDWTSKV